MLRAFRSKYARKIKLLSSLPLTHGQELLIDLPDKHNGRILVEASVIDAMMNYCQTTPDAPESGGCLLGHYRPPHLHITHLTIPMKNDEQSRYRYRRQDKGHLKRIGQFTQKTRTGTYLGEWHTHPESTPNASNIDTDNWNKIFALRKPTLSVFLIIGTKDLSIYLA